MTRNATDADLRQVRDLVCLAHYLLNHPSTAGRVWTKYETKHARRALDALWECRMLLKDIQEDEPNYARVKAGK